MPTPHYRLVIVRRAKGKTAAHEIRYVERGGEYASRADDVLSLGLAGPDLGDWRSVDAAENHCRACVARTMEVAIPYQLSIAEQTDVAQIHADYLRSTYGIAVRFALHRPSGKKGSDPRNTHVHFVLSTRRVDDHGRHQEKVRQFDKHCGGRKAVAAMRGHWQDTVNMALFLAGRDERLDLRTLRAQNIDREAQKRVPRIEFERARRGEIYSRHYEHNQLLARQRQATDAFAAANAELDVLRVCVVRGRINRGRVCSANRVTLTACRRERTGGDRPPCVGGPQKREIGSLPVRQLRDSTARPGRSGAIGHITVDGGKHSPIGGSTAHLGEYAGADLAERSRTDPLAGTTTGGGANSTASRTASVQQDVRTAEPLGGRSRTPLEGLERVHSEVGSGGRGGSDGASENDPSGRGESGLRGNAADPGPATRPGGRARGDDPRGSRLFGTPNDERVTDIGHPQRPLIESATRPESLTGEAESESLAVDVSPADNLAAADSASVNESASVAGEVYSQTGQVLEGTLPELAPLGSYTNQNPRRDESRVFAPVPSPQTEVPLSFGEDHGVPARAGEFPNENVLAASAKPLVTITTKTGGVYYALREDLLAALVHVQRDVPLCTDAGMPITTGRTRLRVSKVRESTVTLANLPSSELEAVKETEDTQAEKVRAYQEEWAAFIQASQYSLIMIDTVDGGRYYARRDDWLAAYATDARMVPLCDEHGEPVMGCLGQGQLPVTEMWMSELCMAGDLLEAAVDTVDDMVLEEPAEPPADEAMIPTPKVRRGRGR